MNYLNVFNFWKNDEFFDESTRKELSSLDEIKDKKEIEERFYKNLEFGTGGLRGIMGAGTNRMNTYTVGIATYGLGLYLLNRFGKEKCRENGVAIGFDTRNNSKAFAQVTANVLSSLGIKALLLSDCRPTPMLSFCVKNLGALAGVVITASHNPKEYNGYKVYDEFGGQITVEQAKDVLSYINSVTDVKAVPFEGNLELVKIIDETDEFLNAVIKESRYFNTEAKENVKIVYTPLHGSGRIPVTNILKKDGFSNVISVLEQSVDDGDFPTVISPNPEDKRALKMGIELAIKENADIVIGTDPDCDRVGVAVKTSDGFTLLSGNQVGALLVDFVLRNTDLKKVKNPAIIKTVVTSELGAEIAKSLNASVFTTLTGFKFIGEKITQFEKARQAKDDKRDFTFVMGYEESYGYLSGTHARDKDAVVSSMLICEMTAKLKSEGKTLLDRLNELYNEFGYYLDYLDSFTLEGKDGLERIKNIMLSLRKNEYVFEKDEIVTDYSVGVEAESGFGYLPKSDVLKYTLLDGSWVTVRPSGTEPKIKIYYSVKSKDKIEGEARLQDLKSIILKATNL